MELKGDAPEAGHHLRIRHPRPGRGTDLSDTIVVMSEGRIQQIGVPTDIYNEPSTLS